MAHFDSNRCHGSLGHNTATLETAAATARREARRLFAQKQTSEGKKRMWQANQITDRLACLAQRPPDTVEPHPASARCQAVLAQGARLQALGIYPDNARRYAHLPAAALDQAEALARSIDGDLPSLVIAFLKRHTEDGWPIPAPPASADAPFDLAKYTGDDSPYRDFFHGSPPTGATFQPVDSADASSIPLAPPDTHAAPPAAVPDQPDWITPARWHSLSPTVRDLLRGSRLVGRTVAVADPWRQTQLAQYAADVRVLVAVARIPAAPMRDHSSPGATL